MSIVVGFVVEVGTYGKHSGGKLNTAWGIVPVGSTRECARMLAEHLFKTQVSVEVSDTSGRVLSVKAVAP